MLLRCWELRDPIRKFQRRARKALTDDNYNTQEDCLTDDNWDEVKAIIQLLEIFYNHIKTLEGNVGGSGSGSLWQTIVNLQEIYEVLTEDVDAIEGYSQSVYLQTGVALAMEKLITYFGQIGMEPTPSLYCVATALHPRLRLNWFKTHWKNHEIWYKKAEKSVRAVYQKYLDNECKADEVTEDVSTPSRRQLPGSYATDARRQRTMRVDHHLLTGKKNSKRLKLTSQLDEYFNSLHEDELLAEDDQRLFDLPDDPHPFGGQLLVTRDFHSFTKSLWITSVCQQLHATVSAALVQLSVQLHATAICYRQA